MQGEVLNTIAILFVAVVEIVSFAMLVYAIK